MLVDVGLIKQKQYDEVGSLYERTGYSGKVEPGDTVVGAWMRDRLVGVVRLAQEHGLIVLRGMQVETKWRRQGIGRQLLIAAGQVLGSRECWCVPYVHLRDFYADLDFEDCSPAGAPEFLVERLRRYEKLGHHVSLLKRASRS